MNEESITVTLTLDNDQTLECLVLTIYETNGQKYIALLPLDEEGDNTDGEVFIYRYLESEDGEPELDNILDDEEYEIAADAFDEWLDTQEFDEMSEQTYSSTEKISSTKREGVRSFPFFVTQYEITSLSFALVMPT